MSTSPNFFDTIDWRARWTEAQCNRRAIDSDSTNWDKRAESFANRTVSNYSRAFIEYLDLKEGESALDMGCGTGEIAIQLAKAGNDVIAADFSKGMLSFLKQGMVEEDIGAERSSGLGSIRPIEMSWTDDWSAHGITEDCVDVAYASRSLIVNDLGAALDKLCLAARKRCAITLAVDSSPSEDNHLLKALGRTAVSCYDMVYTFNILYQMGLRPEIRMIASDKISTYDSMDQAIESALRHVQDPTPEECAVVADYIAAHLVENDDPDDPRPLKLDYSRYSKWAFISWEL